MCGIIAIIGKNDGGNALPLLYPIAYRGEREHFHEARQYANGTLAMNRLTIVDRDRARQPFESADGRYVMVFNGEIYNYKRLRLLLKGKNYRFSTDSDTEVLLNAWIEWKEKCLTKLRGMFAFVILDQNTGRFFAARDPFGIKPLYYTKNGSTTYFSSEIKSLSLLPQSGIIKMVKPGSWISSTAVGQYFSLVQDTKHRSERVVIRSLRKLFDQAVKRRVQTDLPVGVFLSGGIDSTAILATARKFNSNVTAIIVGTQNAPDRVTAVRYCKEFGVPYVVEEPPSEETLAATIPEIVRITESFEPNMIRQSAVSLVISKLAAKHGFKVVLCGEGADELFAGYPEFTFEPEGKKVEENIQKFLKDLHRTQLQRVDRTSMYWTIEVRVPFLDLDFASYALTIPGEDKIRYENGRFITKYILRNVMEDRLPAYIYNRKKVVLSEGAGLKGNQRIGGLFYDFASKQIDSRTFELMKRRYARWHIETKEEAYYFSFFNKYGYTKATFNQKRTSVNKNDTVITSATKKTVERIVTLFGSREFFHAKPLNEIALQDTLQRIVKTNQPISIVLFWGKGKRNAMERQEKQAFKFLMKLNWMVKQIYEPGCSFIIIATDTHARLNGYPAKTIREYFSSIQKFCSESTVSFFSLSKLWKQHHKQLDNLRSTLPQNNKLKQLLVRASKKHSQTVAPNRAGLYYSAALVDKWIIQKQFAGSIFLTYNSPDFNPILPTTLPILYSYSTKKGIIVKPWFQ